jgi:hypothetical protein
VPAERLTTNGQVASQAPPPTSTANDELRVWARKHVERVHKLKRDTAAFVLGMLALTGLGACRVAGQRRSQRLTRKQRGPVVGDLSGSGGRT